MKKVQCDDRNYAKERFFRRDGSYLRYLGNLSDGLKPDHFSNQDTSLKQSNNTIPPKDKEEENDTLPKMK